MSRFAVEQIGDARRAHWCGIGGETCCHDLWCQVHEQKRAFFDTKSWLWKGLPDPLLPHSQPEPSPDAETSQ